MTIVIHEPLSVLLIEDNRDDERLALRALRTCGLPLFVHVARDGELGLRALGLDGDGGAEPPRAPDLIISDLKMPKRRGDEVLLRVREEGRLRDVPFVIFSSSDEAAEISRCLGLGASAFYTKPVDFDRFIECIRTIARQWLGNRASEPFCVVDGTEALRGSQAMR